MESPKTCPICGEPNQCVMAETGDTDRVCWCRDEQFPESLMEKVSVEAERKACICRRCVRKAVEVI